MKALNTAKDIEAVGLLILHEIDKRLKPVDAYLCLKMICFCFEDAGMKFDKKFEEELHAMSKKFFEIKLEGPESAT